MCPADGERTRASWGRRYVGISLVVLGLCLPAIYLAGYLGLSLNELLSYRADDGWCVKGVQSIGQHCFGDYASVNAGLKTGAFWNPKLATATPYPPLALVPPLAFIYLGRLTGSWALGRDLFLALLAASMLLPTLWVSRQARGDRGPSAFLVIGVATAPFLFVLDRGNTTGLLVAPLLGMATAYANKQRGRMLVFIVICTLLKPQMLLLALLFILFRAYWHLVLTVVLSVGLTLVGFIFFPGSLFTNIRDWLHITRAYQGSAAFSSPYPYNLGVGRSLLTVFDLSKLQSLTGAGSRSELASWLQLHAGLFSVVLVVITIAVMFASRRDSNPLFPLLAVCILIMIVPGTSYGYYLALLLVPAAFVLRDPDRERWAQRATERWWGMLDRDPTSDSRWDHASRWLLICGLTLLLVPLVVPIKFVPLFFSDVPLAKGLGAIQLLWGPILLVLFILTTSMALIAPRQATSARIEAV
jgi:hypothetical protein